jgi:outer membrane protein OmpA-like peptidoglycan-associated protein
MKSHLILSSCLALALAYPALAQDPAQSTPALNDRQSQNSDPNRVEPMDKTPLYHVTVVERSAKAVNYQHRGGATKINFKGTDLMPQANGEAKVESKQGYIEIETEFDELNKPASSFGPEYMTYVMWAISPQGRAENLGEVILNGNRSKLDVTTQMQAFALIVTAEPYFAVRTPSNLVVMENVIRPDTKGMPEVVDAKYELLERGEYQDDIREANLQPLVQGDRKVPLELLEARNAARIAQWSKANQYAQDSFIRAQNLLEQAQKAQDQNAGANKQAVVRLAREAVQTFDDARTLSLRRREEERVATERREAEQREAAARAQAEQQQQLAQQAQQNAQLAQQNAQLEAQQRQQAEQERLAAEQARQQAEAATQQAQLERQQADAARQAAIQQQQQLAAQTQQAQLQAQQANQEKEQLRARLRDQLNQVLQTRDTAKGLIVNMSDVLFDTGKATLRAGAREKLAKVAGILIAYPDLRLSLGGHTDSTGTLSFNQQLSQQRAAAVRDYLVSQGLKSTEIVAVDGFGPSQPVASNATPAGRQQNRRVEIVVAGDAIGNNVAPGASNGAVSAQQ